MNASPEFLDGEKDLSCLEWSRSVCRRSCIPARRRHPARLCCHQLPEWVQRIEGQGFAVCAQARMSPKMIEPVDEGLSATYREPSAQATPPLVDCDGAKAAFGKQARTTSIRGVWQQSDVQRSCVWRSASARPTCVLWSIVSFSWSVSLVNTVFRAAVGWWRVFAARGGGRRRG